MYNITIEYEDHNERYTGLSYKQAQHVIEVNQDSCCDIWVSVCGLPAYSIIDFPMLW